MVLAVGKSYITKNGKTTVTQGEETPEQQAWWLDNRDKPINERPYLTLTPAQELYLALCKNGFKLQEALESCGLTDEQKVEAQKALNILDANGNQQNVNEAGIVTEVTRPSFFGADLQGYDLRGADLWGANLQGANLQDADLQGADLREAVLWGADLWGANLRGANLWRAELGEAKLQGANLRGAQMQSADLWRADLSLADVSGADFSDASLKDVTWDLASYEAGNPPLNLLDAIKGQLVALDTKSYEQANKLNEAYQNALQSDNQEAITAAEEALTKHLEQCRQDNAKKAVEKTVFEAVSEAVSVLGVAAISIVVQASAGPTVTITGASQAEAAEPSGQSDVSLGGGDVNPYERYGYGSR